MLQIERLDYIKQLLEANGSVSTSELIERLNVSKATVHRYLNRLQEERFAELTRGGAILAKKGGLYEQPYRVKRNQFTEEKSRIAHSASQMIRRNESIFLDSSSTVFEMTKYIGSYKDLLVATNDVLIASSLSEAEGITVSVIGGTLRKHFYTLTGPFSEQFLKDVYLDTAFVGIDSINLKAGCMVTNAEEVSIKKLVIEAAEKTVVLCDHSKFEQVSFLKMCDPRDIHTVITGKELKPEIYEKYTEQGYNIILA